MSHIELRELDDDDLDAVFAMMSDPEGAALAAFTTQNPSDRASFDEWAARERSADDVFFGVVTEDGGFAGTIAAFTVGSDREVTFWTTRNAWGRGVASEALRILVSREPLRPLFARVAAHNVAAVAVLQKNGFTEVSRSTIWAPALGREADEIVFVLPPTLDGI